MNEYPEYPRTFIGLLFCQFKNIHYLCIVFETAFPFAKRSYLKKIQSKNLSIL